MAVANTTAYYDTGKITVIKCFYGPFSWGGGGGLNIILTNFKKTSRGGQNYKNTQHKEFELFCLLMILQPTVPPWNTKKHGETTSSWSKLFRAIKV